MKKLNRKTRWYQFFDGENVIITTHPEQYRANVGILVPLSADEAATMFALMLSKKSAVAEEGGEDNA